MSRPPFSRKRKGKTVDPYPLGPKEKGKSKQTKKNRGRPRKPKEEGKSKRPIAIVHLNAKGEIVKVVRYSTLQKAYNKRGGFKKKEHDRSGVYDLDEGKTHVPVFGNPVKSGPDKGVWMKLTVGEVQNFVKTKKSKRTKKDRRPGGRTPQIIAASRTKEEADRTAEYLSNKGYKVKTELDSGMHVVLVPWANTGEARLHLEKRAKQKARREKRKGAKEKKKRRRSVLKTIAAFETKGEADRVAAYLVKKGIKAKIDFDAGLRTILVPKDKRDEAVLLLDKRTQKAKKQAARRKRHRREAIKSGSKKSKEDLFQEAHRKFSQLRKIEGSTFSLYGATDDPEAAKKRALKRWKKVHVEKMPEVIRQTDPDAAEYAVYVSGRRKARRAKTKKKKPLVPPQKGKYSFGGSDYSIRQNEKGWRIIRDRKAFKDRKGNVRYFESEKKAHRFIRRSHRGQRT